MDKGNELDKTKSELATSNDRCNVLDQQLAVAKGSRQWKRGQIKGYGGRGRNDCAVGIVVAEEVEDWRKF